MCLPRPLTLSWPCRLIKELASLKRAAASGLPQPTHQLCVLLGALANSVSFIDEKRNALLISEVQGITLWRADAVRL